MSIITECMKTDNLRIQVIMSTYNAEKYLRPQLDSILNQQTGMEISVLVRDDGSKDGTIDILIEYAEKYGISVLAGDNMGTTRSYYELIRARDRTCDYFAMSDHDDVWLPGKLETARAFIDENKLDMSKSILFASRSTITDEQLNPIGMTRDTPKGVGFYNAMIQNVTAGHTQVLNRALMDIVSDVYSPDISALDWWIYMLASAVGTVVFYSDPLVLYRQHDSNLFGYKANAAAMFFRRFRRLINEGGKGLVNQLRALRKLDLYIPDGYLEEIERFVSSQSNILSRIKYAATAKTYRQSGWETIAFKTLYVIGTYNTGGKNA